MAADRQRDRQTDRQTDRHADCKTSHPYRVEVMKCSCILILHSTRVERLEKL